MTGTDAWLTRAMDHLHFLCAGKDRRPGSAENLASTTYVAEGFAREGWSVSQSEFDVVGWDGGDGVLTVEGIEFPLHASPYSFGVEGRGDLVFASTLEELRSRDLPGAIVVLHGALTAQPLTPKNYPFYQVAEHQQLIELLEATAPVAIIAATGQCPEIAGALRPFPFVEDGAFCVPAGHVDEQAGQGLAAYDGRPARVALVGHRRPARARNVIGRVGRERGRVTVMAHIDTKVRTPGAVDNASGVTVLLLLAEMLDRSIPIGVELLVVNGEDYYNAAGEVQYLSEHDGDLGDVALAVNIDGAGYREGRTAYSLYNCEPRLAAHAGQLLAGQGLVEGPQWWQSDHAIFAMRGQPAVALTSERLDTVLRKVAHSPADTVEQVDAARLVQAAGALRALIESLHPS
jgi:aminopeptidase YwaD